MMQCSHCSAQLSPTASFCPNCGQPTSEKNDPHFGFTKNHFKQILIIVAVSVLIVGSIGFFFLESKSTALNAIKNSKALVVDTADKTGKVNHSLEAIYNYVTVQTNNTTESSAWPRSSIRLASVSNAQDNPTLNLNFLQANINDALDGLRNKKVKAFSTSNTDPLKAYRDLKDLSVEAQRQTSAALDTTKQLANFKDSPESATLKKSQNQISKVLDQTTGYLDEAEKTANYYQTYTDVYINLATTIVSTLNSTDAKLLNDNLAQAKNIETQMKSLKSTDLPGEIENFHKDILTEIEAALNFMTTFSSAVVSKDANAVNQASSAASNWINEEKSLVPKIQTDQTNFWKNNSVLSGFDFLSATQNSLVHSLEEEQKTEQFFIIK